jgi:hypothetical protein
VCVRSWSEAQGGQRRQGAVCYTITIPHKGQPCRWDRQHHGQLAGSGRTDEMGGETSCLEVVADSVEAKRKPTLLPLLPETVACKISDGVRAGGGRQASHIAGGGEGGRHSAKPSGSPPFCPCCQKLLHPKSVMVYGLEVDGKHRTSQAEGRGGGTRRDRTSVYWTVGHGSVQAQALVVLLTVSMCRWCGGAVRRTSAACRCGRRSVR